MQIVPINNGYSYIKSDLGYSFRSAYRKTNVSEYCSTGDTLVLDGQAYIIGDGIYDINKDKTVTVATKLFVLNMLCKHMELKSTEHFKVLLTAPPMTYASQKDKLPQYLKGSYKIEYNGKIKDIFIDSVTVYPETVMAYLANNPGQFTRPVLVIDVGGLTTNMVLIKKGNYNQDSIVSFSNGMYHVEEEVCEFLNNKYMLDLESSDMHDFMSQGIYLGKECTNLIEVEKDAIDNICNKAVSQIAQKIAIKKWNPATCVVLVTGGGGKALFPTIQKFYDTAILGANPIFDNLNGLSLLIAKDNKNEVAIGR